MPLLVTAATGPELTAALPPLQGRELPEQQAIPLTWRGRELLAYVTGVGPVNAALALGLILGARTDIRGVLNTGLAGSFDLEALPLGALALVTEEILPEYGLCSDCGISDAQALRFPQWSPRDQGPVFAHLPLPDCAAELGFSLPAGLARASSLTVAGVSATPARARALRSAFPALLENMEGFAVALACARRGIPCVELRCVSNLVGAQEARLRDFSGALRVMAATLPDILNP